MVAPTTVYGLFRARNGFIRGTGETENIPYCAYSVFADTSYSGVTNNATTHLQSLIDAASAAYSSDTGRVRVVVPSGVWMVDGLVWKSNVWYDWGDAIIRKRSEGAAPYNRIIGTIWPRVETGGTYYGQADNIKSTGGRFETNSIGCLNGIFVLDEGRNCEIVGATVVHSPSVQQWAIQVSGRDVRLLDCNVLGGTVLYQDGIHLKYGDNISVIGGYVESGDDAIALGWDIVSASQDYDDEALSNVIVTGVTVRSEKASAVKVYYGLDTPGIGGTNRRKVRNAIIDVVGSGGITRNNGIAILDATQALTDRSVIENVKITATLDVGSTAHDGNNAYGVYVQTGTDLTINAGIRFTDSTGGATRFRPIYICNGTRINISLTQNGAVGLPSLINPSNASAVVSDIVIQDFDVISANVSAVGAFDVSNTVGTTGSVVLRNGFVREIDDACYGVFAVAGTAISSLAIDGVTFRKKSGSTTSRAYASNVSGMVAYFGFTNNDLSDLSAFTNLTTFGSYHPAYNIQENRGLRTVISGFSTIPAASLSVTVTPGAGVRFAASDYTSIGQVTVSPAGPPTSAAANWYVNSVSDTQFLIATDIAPGGSGLAFNWTVDTGRKPIF